MDRDVAEPRVDDVPGPRASEWVEHHLATAAPSTQLYDFVWDATAAADGPFCTDVDGNVFLDFTSHVAAAPLGYNHPAVTERLAELGGIDPAKIAGQDLYASAGWPPDDSDLPGPTQLMDRLVEITPDALDTVFLSNSGAEAVENAIKICYAARDAQGAITFDGAFHGRTLGALSLNRSKAVHRRGFPELAGVTAVPYCTDSSCTRGTCACGFFPNGGAARLDRLLDPASGPLDPDEVAYIIVEPIQGEGGVRVPSDAFLEAVAEACANHDIPLITDEIQAGLGRTGEWWASDSLPIEPDVIAAGKGLRVGATVAAADTFPAERGRLSSTWGAGDLYAALSGAVTIEVIREAGLLGNAAARGEQLLERLRDDAGETVADVRGSGLLVGVEFDTAARRNAVMANAFRRQGLLTLPAGVKTLRLLPPLDVTEREIDLGVDRLLAAIDAADGP